MVTNISTGQAFFVPARLTIGRIAAALGIFGSRDGYSRNTLCLMSEKERVSLLSKRYPPTILPLANPALTDYFPDRFMRRLRNACDALDICMVITLT